jgi:hypothetical protein
VAEILYQGMASREHVGSRQLLEPAHGPSPLLEMAVIPLQAVSQMVGRAVLGGWEHRSERRRVAASRVCRDPLRNNA